MHPMRTSPLVQKQERFLRQVCKNTLLAAGKRQGPACRYQSCGSALLSTYYLGGSWIIEGRILGISFLATGEEVGPGRGVCTPHFSQRDVWLELGLFIGLEDLGAI